MGRAPSGFRCSREAARSATPHVPIDDDERRRLGNAAAPGEVVVLLVVESVDAEGVVVSSPLQHLGEKALDPARVTRAAAVEEEQLRTRRRRRLDGYGVGFHRRLGAEAMAISAAIPMFSTTR